VGAIPAGDRRADSAFAAALFSTVSREAGSVWELSFWRRPRSCWPLSSALPPLPYSRAALLPAVSAKPWTYDVTARWNDLYPHQRRHGIAAINTGNNLLYVIVAALLSAILVSGVASAQVLRSLALDVHLPEHVFAGRRCWRACSCATPVVAAVVFRARGSRKTQKKERWSWEAYTFGWPATVRPRTSGFAFPTPFAPRSRRAEKPILRESVYFPFLAPLQDSAPTSK